MEELNIEEKAKRYDDAIKVAKRNYETIVQMDNDCTFAKEGIVNTFHHMFPELKENEDERIRKSIIENLKGNMCRTDGDYDLLNKQITWLEKQGEQDPYNGVSFKYNGHTWGMCARDNGVDILLDRQLIKHLEKQGEQKQDPCEHCADKRLNCHYFPCTKKRAFKQGKSVFDIINEEKVDNVNKIEPKFHKGDWVVKKDGELFSNGSHYARITDIDKEQYWLDSGTWIESKYIRLYNISDAKDGDVLNSTSHHLIWIYKDNEHYYACVNMNYVTENVATDGLIKIPSDACPATKEQRDVLFEKMHEAGYEWDAEKKKLKKIEQKSAWSEEDENLLELSFENLTELKDRYGEEYGKVGDCISWLKSLKQRYTWKPSDEQIEAFEHLVRSVGESGYASPYENNTKLLYSLLEQLKKGNYDKN